VYEVIVMGGLVDLGDPANSSLLLKPLAVGAGGQAHGGGDLFADTSDADYQTILAWIESGALPTCEPDGGAAPMISGIVPATGSFLGTEAVVISGANFTAEGAGTTRVVFGDIDATSVQVTDDNTITCITPAHPLGTADVQVINDNGTDTLADGFTFIPSVPVPPPSSSR
jgi:hypothetical protein